MAKRESVRQWFVLLALALALSARANVDEIGTAFRPPSPAEAQSLRALLAAPVPAGATRYSLSLHFDAKHDAAVRLGDDEARLAVLREQVRLAPDDRAYQNLGVTLLSRGEFTEGNALVQRAIDEARNDYQRVFSQASLALAMYRQFRDADARKWIAEAGRALPGLVARARAADARLVVSRVKMLLVSTQALLAERAGRFDEAVAAAASAVVQAKQSMNLDSMGGSTQYAYAAEELSGALLRWTAALIASGRYGAAEAAVAQHLALTQEVQFSPVARSLLYAVGANLRFAQGEFAAAAALLQRSDAALQDLALGETHPRRVRLARELALAHWARSLYRDAADIFERLDALAGADPQLQDRVRCEFERGLVYLKLGRSAEAAALFALAGDKRSRVYGENHWSVHQAVGLQGAALWESRQAEAMEAAKPLLAKAANGLMASSESREAGDAGIRKEVQAMIYMAYLDAVTSSSAADAVEAIGIADLIRGSAVQEALVDAAARSAAGSSRLAGLVRRDQDAKHELAGLKRYLSGGLGAGTVRVVEVETRIRARIRALEASREALKSEVDSLSPEYARLVRPQPVSAAEVGGALGPREALILMVPAKDTVLVWVATSDRPVVFGQVSLALADLESLVKAMRAGLDFEQAGGRVPAFDASKAHALYKTLLAPFEASLSGKTHWIIAAGGALGQLPFAMLLTREAAAGLGPDAPWLIRQAALTQLPSIGAWLASRRLARSTRAEEALIGWADPLFGAMSVEAGSRGRAATRSTLMRGKGADSEGVPRPVGELKYSEMPSLPDTRDELLAVAALLESVSPADIRIGAQATRQSVIDASRAGHLARKRVVYFATHGLIPGDLPGLDQPALALAATGREGEDPLAPLLTLEDVLSLHLNADWVVLSACNTAAADGQGEEALSGLARAFFYAGARSLLVTHSAVETVSARVLTTSLFRQYVARPSVGRSESLRRAMLEMIASPKFSHPAFWAPYAVVGDGER